MIKDEKNIDKIIKEKFEDFHASPPSHIWRNIKGSVAGGSSLFLLQKFLSSPVGAGISVVTGVAIAVIGYNVLSGDKKTPENIPENKVEKVIELPAERNIISSNEQFQPTTSNAFTEPQEEASPDADGSTIKSKINKPDAVRSVTVGADNNSKIAQQNHIDEYTGVSLINDQSLPEEKNNYGEENKIPIPETDQKTITTDETGQAIVAETEPAHGTIEDANKQLSDDKEYADIDDKTLLTGETPDLSNRAIEKIIIENIPLQKLKTGPSALSNTSVSDSALFTAPAPTLQLKDDYGKRSNLSFGLFYTPEKIYYPLRENQKSNTIDVNGIFYFSDFLVQSGAGISIVEDLCDYNVNYKSFEIVGSYYAVDSLSFDTINNIVIPTYYTTLHNVYDSVNGSCGSSPMNKYTYLRIPLIFGYKKDFKRVSYFIKGGPVLNLLVKSSEPEPHHFASDISVQQIDRQTPGRIKTYWQLYLGVGLTYQLSRRFGLLIEPTASYNLSSIYEHNYMTSKRPYSLGLRTGILINL